MQTQDIINRLGEQGEPKNFASLIRDLGSVALPSLDREEPDQHYDWILIRRFGLELGFVDTAYFSGLPEAFWCRQGVTLQQVIFYNKGRKDILPYMGKLPFELIWSDIDKIVNLKMSKYEASRRTYFTDYWHIDNKNIVISYRKDKSGIDSIRISLPVPPLPEIGRLQPTLNTQEWIDLLGIPYDSKKLLVLLDPLRFSYKQINEDNELDFLEECGLVLYFKQKNENFSSSKLVLNSVKFHRSRDINSRQYNGELPFNLLFDDSPSCLDKKIGRTSDFRKDGPMTGYAHWQFDAFSLRVLYSTIENYIFRVTLINHDDLRVN